VRADGTGGYGVSKKVEGGTLGPSFSARKLLNASGYMFQLGVKHAVESTSYDSPQIYGHRWEVVGWEDPWSDSEEETGFIDLVLKRGEAQIVVECKRDQDGHWVFPVAKHADVTSRLFVLNLKAGSKNHQIDAFWDRANVSPMSFEAEFCVRGAEDKKRTPTLEDESQKLLASVDAVAVRLIEQMKDDWKRGQEVMPQIAGKPAPRAILPMIVTNARLSIATVDYSSISLEDGSIPDSTEIEEVDCVRFCKNLAVPELASFKTEESIAPGIRSVLIVQARRLAQVLGKLS
jgi:hypothetical protein